MNHETTTMDHTSLQIVDTPFRRSNVSFSAFRKNNNEEEKLLALGKNRKALEFRWIMTYV